MSGNLDEIDQIYWQASQLAAGDDRIAYLDSACGHDRNLRRRVEKLLNAQPKADHFLERPFGSDLTATLDASSIAERPGAMIGRYELLQQIGEGGMGVVYMAEQREPVHRKVALKIIKPGMDTREVIARFEAERQALALMEHPNVAHVLDAGATDSGRPYFVMELVCGVPITEFCDRNNLTTRERLELYVQVCQAVQHAHQKGIIHRDLKPSNVLVAPRDGVPVPKIIDFGVAKATNRQLTDKTAFTDFGQMVGTPLYMSPEQAEVNCLDVDTRSDIYSLGVLLYELLTGTTPFDKDRLRKAGIDEVRRVIREEEPLRPSTRISTLGAAATTASMHRKTDPAKLSHALRGELDWIVMKALEKDRARRYETANGLANDIERHLNDEPVVACPPSAAYRFRKFARRNKIALITVAIVALVLALGLLGTTWQAIRATRAERAAVAERDAKEQARQAAVASEQRARAAAEAERQAREAETTQRQKAEMAEKQSAEAAAVATAINEFLQFDLLEMAGAQAQADGQLQPDPDVKLGTLLDRALAHVDERFASQPAVRTGILDTLSGTLLAIGRHREAIRLKEQVLDYYERTLGRDHRDTLVAMNGLAVAYGEAGLPDKALALQGQTVELLRKIQGPEHRNTLVAMSNLGGAYCRAGLCEKAVASLEQTLEAERKILGPEDPETRRTMDSLAVAYRSAGQYERSVALHEQTVELERKISGPEHPRTLAFMNNLAVALEEVDQLDRALPLLEQVLQIERKMSGPKHPGTLVAMGNLSELYRTLGRFGEAEQLQVQTLEIERSVLGQDHPNTLISMGNLALIYRAQTRYEEAEQLHVQALEIERRVLGTDHPDTLSSIEKLAQLYELQERYGEAEPLRCEVLETRRRVSGADHPDTLDAIDNLAYVYLCAKAPEKALPLLNDEIQRRKAKLAADPSGAAPLASSLCIQATCLRQLARWTEAEAAARDSLALNPVGAPNRECRFAALRILGECLTAQQKYADAEPFLYESYEGLKTLAAENPALASSVATAIQSLAQLYEAWGKPEEAATWREQLEALKAGNEAGGGRPEAAEKKE